MKTVFYALCSVVLIVYGILPRLQADDRGSIEKLIDQAVQKAQSYGTNEPWKPEQ